MISSYHYRFSFGYGLTAVVKKLLIIMVAVFLLQSLVSSRINLYLGLVPLLVWKRYFIWQLFTYIFLHGGISHLLFNLLGIYLFGGELENYWGSKKFAQFFFFCGIGAAVCTVLFSPAQGIPVIGASGAIYGLLLAYGWLFPNRMIYIYFLIPVPAKYFVTIFGLIELFTSIQGTGGGVAHITHLGGLIFGLLYIGFPRIKQRLRQRYYRRKWRSPGSDRKNYYH